MNRGAEEIPVNSDEVWGDLESQIVKLVFSKQSVLRVCILKNADINIWSRIFALQRRARGFRFSYFYWSGLVRQTDWLLAISGKSAESSRKHHARHSPTMRDWHNVYLNMKKSSGMRFMIVLDNASRSARFKDMKRKIIKFMALHQKYLSISFKYLLIKRI